MQMFEVGTLCWLTIAAAVSTAGDQSRCGLSCGTKQRNSRGQLDISSILADSQCICAMFTDCGELVHLVLFQEDTCAKHQHDNTYHQEIPARVDRLCAHYESHTSMRLDAEF